MSTVLEKMGVTAEHEKEQKQDQGRGRGKSIQLEQGTDKYLSEFVNKVVVCETLSGKTITGVLTGYNKYELILMEVKDIKSKNPAKILVYKHGLVTIREIE
jgi:small nuclear ribonucleoprotein (snRNP)-like protein